MESLIARSSVTGHHTNVLQNHRKRNRPVHPPSGQKLTIAAKAQSHLEPQAPQNASRKKRRTEHPPERPPEPEPTEPTEDNTPDTDGVTERPIRAKRHSKTPYGSEAKPTQLRYYSGGWCEVLDRAKKAYQIFLVTNYALPSRKRGLQEARDILAEEIVHYEEDGTPLEEGHYDPKHMSILVYLRTDSAPFFLTTYSIDLQRRCYISFKHEDDSSPNCPPPLWFV